MPLLVWTFDMDKQLGIRSACASAQFDQPSLLAIATFKMPKIRENTCKISEQSSAQAILY